MSSFTISRVELAFLFLVPGILFVLVYLSYPFFRRSFSLLVNGNPGLLRSHVRRYLLREGSFILALCALILGTLEITWGTKTVLDTRKGLDVVFVLDVSRSMLANDVSPTRLEFAKSTALSLIASFPDTRFGVVAFKGEAVRAVPLTEDRVALEQYLRNLDPASLLSRGTSLAAGLREGLKSFPPQGNRGGVVILLTDGDTRENLPSQTLLEYRRRGFPVLCVGVGTERGATVADPLPIKRKDGSVVISQLGSTLLKKIASETGGFYIQYGSGSVHRILWEKVQQIQKQKETVRTRPVPAERYGFFLGLAVVFLFLHILVRVFPWQFDG